MDFFWVILRVTVDCPIEYFTHKWQIAEDNLTICQKC